MEDLKVWLGYDNLLTVNPVNTWGGLALFLEKQCRSRTHVFRQESFGC